MNWVEELVLPDEYSEYCDIFINMLAQFASSWDEHLGSIKVVQHRTELKKTDNRPIYSAAHSAGPSTI